jgi:hypothetical protein
MMMMGKAHVKISAFCVMVFICRQQRCYALAPSRYSFRATVRRYHVEVKCRCREERG